jgi:hypothetical protein
VVAEPARKTLAAGATLRERVRFPAGLAARDNFDLGK